LKLDPSTGDPCSTVVTAVCQLLSKPKYSGVEKIKTIGSTYMVAAGLLRHGTTRKVLKHAAAISVKVPPCGE